MALAFLALGSICRLVEQELEPGQEHPAGHLYSFDVWGLGLGHGDMCWSQVLTDTAKDT